MGLKVYQHKYTETKNHIENYVKDEQGFIEALRDCIAGPDLGGTCVADSGGGGGGGYMYCR